MEKSVLVCPGDKLFSAADYTAGRGTYIKGKHIYASAAGIPKSFAPETANGNKKPVVEVLRGEARIKTPEPGNTVIARITKVNPRLASASLLCINTQPLNDSFTGIIRQQDVRATEIDKVEIYSSFRPGDLVRAQVVSLGDSRSYFLSTARNDCGVVYAKSTSGYPMIPLSWQEMQCPQTKVVEKRKAEQIAKKTKGAEQMPGHVLVTVGSTKFDQLIQAVDTEAFVAALHERGYDSLLVQRGNGEYIPHVLLRKGQDKAQLSSGLKIEFVQYLPSMHAYMEAAGLIISHAGSGSLFEALSLNKPIIAVPNAILMANHQEELAVHLDRLGHLASATPETLAQAVRKLDVSRLKPYPKGSPQGIADAVHRLMGF